MVTTFPTYASPEEMGMQIALEAERSFNDIFMRTGIEELQKFDESGVVTESNIATLKDKIIKWLNGVWESIKTAWNTILKFVKEQADKVRDKIKKLALGKEAELKKKAEAVLKDDKVYGKAYTWDGYDETVAFQAGPVKTACDVFSKKMQEVSNVARSYNPNREEDELDYTKTIARVVDEIENEAKKELKITETTSSAVAAGVKKIIAGEEKDLKKADIIKNWSEYYKLATDFGTTASKVKTNLAEVKKTFDTGKKVVERVSRENKSDAVLAGVVTVIKKDALLLNSISTATVSCVKSRSTEASKIVLRVAVGIAKKEKSKESVMNDSAIVPSAFQTELASLFEI